MIAPVVAVLMTVVAYSDATEPLVRNSHPMPPAQCQQLADALIEKLADGPPPDEHPVIAWSITCQMERSDARQ